MQIIKRLFFILLITTVTVPCLALPPFEVLRTCIDGESYEHMSTITEIEGAGYAKKSMDGCEDQHHRTIDGHIYGTLFCNDKFYFIIRDKKIDPEKAVDNSVKPNIKPGFGFTTRALWYKIGFNSKDYLCINAPISEQGIGAAYSQYYIIENAFEAKIDPRVYFYFFDKDIAPSANKNVN